MTRSVALATFSIVYTPAIGSVGYPIKHPSVFSKNYSLGSVASNAFSSDHLARQLCQGPYVAPPADHLSYSQCYEVDATRPSWARPIFTNIPPPPLQLPPPLYATTTNRAKPKPKTHRKFKAIATVTAPETRHPSFVTNGFQAFERLVQSNGPVVLFRSTTTPPPV